MIQRHKKKNTIWFYSEFEWGEFLFNPLALCVHTKSDNFQHNSRNGMIDEKRNCRGIGQPKSNNSFTSNIFHNYDFVIKISPYLLDRVNTVDRCVKVYPFMPVAPRTAWLLWLYLSIKMNFQKIYGEAMLNKIYLTTLLQIFCEFMIHSKVIFESI